MKRTFRFLSLLAVFLLVTAIQANALPWVSGSNVVIDLSAEYILNKVVDERLIEGAAPANTLYFNASTGTYYTTDNGDKTLDVGDRLRSIFRVHEIQNSSGPNFLPGTSMFAGVSEIEVLSKTSVSPGVFNFNFGVSSNFSSQYTTPGALIAMHYFDNSNPFAWENGGVDALGVAHEEALVSNVTGAPLYWTFGFTGASLAAAGGEGWEALAAPDNIGLFSLLTTTQQTGNFYFGLSLLDNPLGPQILKSVDQNPLPPFIPLFGDGSDNYLYGSGGLFGIKRDNGQIFTPFDATDSLRAEVNVNIIPEPTTLVLLGFGLLAVAGVNRRKIR